MEYYQRIRNIREDMDLKQYEFANKIGVLPKTYNLYENGLRAIPIDVFNKILKEFCLSLDYVLGLSDTKVYPNLKPMVKDSISENFKNFRKLSGMSQTEVANLLNCNQQTLSEYERGCIKVPWEILREFCILMKISADTVTGRTKKIISLKENERRVKDCWQVKHFYLI